jgi:dolichyl-phosphate-mannose-protein mannosyltransferase
VAAAFWTKYSAVPFAVSLGLFLLFDPVARRAWRTPGPYLAALAFVVVIAPHVWWLVNNQEISPFVYADLRARVAERWYEYVEFPARWIGSQFFFILPALGLLALAYWPRPQVAKSGDSHQAFARRYVTMLAFGPFLVVTLTALVLGRLPILLWGYPLYTFIPLAALVWFGPVTDVLRQRAFAAGVVILFSGIVVLYAGLALLEPLVSKRVRATDFPGKAVSEQLTRVWREKFNAPLAYVTGDDLAANNVAAYSSDHPHVVTHGMPERAAWIDMNDVRRRGVVIVWTEAGRGEVFMDLWKSRFPFEETSVIELPLQTWGKRPPIRVRYAIVPPRR